MTSRAREICMLGCVLPEIHRLASRRLCLHSFGPLKITLISILLLSDLKNTLRAEIPPAAAIEHRQRQDSVFARKCMHCHPPHHFSSSKECGTWLSSHQSSIVMHDGQRPSLYKVNELTNRHKWPSPYHAQSRASVIEKYDTFHHYEYETSHISRVWINV